jgi:hypothetical protein
MPIKGQSPKQIVHTEMHKFKHGQLHSGSKHGPLVKSRKQAIAIALSESGQSRKKRAYGGPADFAGMYSSQWGNPASLPKQDRTTPLRRFAAGGGDASDYDPSIGGSIPRAMQGVDPRGEDPTRSPYDISGSTFDSRWPIQLRIDPESKHENMRGPLLRRGFEMRPSLNPFIGRYQDGGATQVGPDEIAAQDFGDRFYPGYVATLRGSEAPGLFNAMHAKARQMRQDMPHPIQYTRPERPQPYFQGEPRPDDEIGKFMDRRGYQEGGDVPPLSANAQAWLDQHGSREEAINAGIDRLKQAYRTETPYWSRLLTELRGPQTGGAVPQRLMRPPRTDFNYQEGGGVDDLPDVGPPAIPSGGEFSPGTKYGRAAADVGSRMGYDIATLGMPRRYVGSMIEAAKTQPGSEEAHQAYGDVGAATGEMGLSMAGGRGGPSNTFGVFVGPYGAAALKNRAEEGIIKPHPVVANEFSAGKTGFINEHTPVKFDDKTMSAIQDIRDDQAHRELMARKYAGVFRDQDVFQKSGWSFSQNGMPMKEIVDSGAKIKKVPGTKDEYRLDHPAGDFHAIYEMPNFKLDPSLGKGRARMNQLTNQIVIGDPKDVPSALHEVQHVIGKYEGLPRGAGLKAPNEDILQREMFEGQNLPEYQKRLIQEYDKRMANPKPTSPEVLENLKSGRGTALAMAYAHDPGENLANAVRYRYQKPLRYLQHPEQSNLVPYALQGKGIWDEGFDKPWNWRGPAAAYKKTGGRTKFADGGAPGSSSQQADQSPFTNQPSGPSASSVRPNPKASYDPRTGKVSGFASGGFQSFNPMKAMSIGLSRDASRGLLKSEVPGRTDHINTNVPQGAYIIPADVVSGIGQGNTDAGGAILGKLMTRGPYNMNLQRSKAGSRAGPRHSSKGFIPKMPFAAGGMARQPGKPTPIAAAGGEFVVDPAHVRNLGHGDLDLGHNILDKFIELMREKHIATLKKLPPPKGSKDAKK